MNSVDLDFPTPIWNWKNWLYFIMTALVLAVFLWGILCMITDNIDRRDSACQDLGYEGFTTKWFTDYCINNTEVIEVIVDCNQEKCIVGRVK